MVTHWKEALRTTATGKLLLLAHPHARLIIRGVPEHDAELARVARRQTAVCLYPSADAVEPRALLRGGGVCGDLDLIVLDGTWSQARCGLTREHGYHTPTLTLALPS